MSVVLPTLTLTGWVYDKNLLIKKVLEYFITSDYSESIIYYGKISSFKYLVKEYGHDKYLLRDNIKSTLENLYKRYFKEVNVDIDVKEDKNNELNIYLELLCYDENNVKYTLSQSFSSNINILEAVDKKIIRSNQ